MAVLCGLGVLAVTVALLIVLRPRDDGADTPTVTVPPFESAPIDSVPTDSLPIDSVPIDSAPASTAAPAP